jgi:hypothetical protein
MGMMGETSPARREDGTGARGAMAPSELRASHEDRDLVVETLRMAAGDGRLTAEELDERLEAALIARTVGELAVLTTDLPAAGQVTGAVVPEPKDVVRIQCGSGSAQRNGSWVVPRRIDLSVSSGSVKLDFTEAVITRPVLKIDADVHSGSLRLVTKPGIVVDTDDVSVRSGTAKVRTSWGSDVPTLLRVEVSGRVGSGSIVARPPRRSFWDWLLRRPIYPAIPAR